MRNVSTLFGKDIICSKRTRVPPITYIMGSIICLAPLSHPRQRHEHVLESGREAQDVSFA